MELHRRRTIHGETNKPTLIQAQASNRIQMAINQKSKYSTLDENYFYKEEEKLLYLALL